MVEIFKKTKVATKNKAVFNKAICANEIKYMGINSIVSNIYRFIEEILYSKTLDEYCNSINASENKLKITNSSTHKYYLLLSINIKYAFLNSVNFLLVKYAVN